MRILYVGELYPGYVNTCHMRMKILTSLGHSVEPLCTLPHQAWGGRYGGAAYRRLLWGPPLNSCNRNIRLACKRLRPDMVWIDKGRWVFPETLDTIRRRYKSTLVHYTPDPAITYHASRHFKKSVPLYDLIVTNKSYEIQQYNALGARRVFFHHSAFDSTYHRRSALDATDVDTLGCDIVFIGTYCAGRETYLRPASQTTSHLAIWGNQWSKCRDSSIRASIRGRALAGTEYAKGISAAKIALALLSPLVPDCCTTRSVEIPACGTFMLGQRTDEHLALFEEGREAEFFDSVEELCDKARFYLKDAHARERVAAAGRERCVRSGYSYQNYIPAIMEHVRDIRT